MIHTLIVSSASSLMNLHVLEQKVSRLEEQEKDVVSALRYFKTIVDKMNVDTKVLMMLPGSASKVLEAVLPLVQGETRVQHRSGSHTHSYQHTHTRDAVRQTDSDLSLSLAAQRCPPVITACIRVWLISFAGRIR